MKRNALLKYIKANGCEFVREGGRHSWWINPEMNKRSAVPRHTEIKDNLVRKICKRPWDKTYKINITKLSNFISCIVAAGFSLRFSVSDGCRSG